MTATRPEPTLSPLAMRRRAITACLIGNLFEIFDFGVYGYFAVQIGKAIFPATDPVTSVLASFATYGVGFLMRPVGAMVLGSYGDRHGRKAALAVTIVMMAVATGLTGLVPSYARIGIWAPVLLVLCRLIQGFSTGGEWGGATAFLIEYAPPERRGFYGSLQQLSTGVGQIIAVSTALAAHSFLSVESLDQWGWRVPFLFGLLMAPLGYYLRARVAETPDFETTEREHHTLESPLKAAFTTHRGAVFTCFGLTMVWTVASYVFITLMPTYAVQSLKMDARTAFEAVMLASLANIVMVPISGLLSDRVGRLAPMTIATVGFLLLTIPLFFLLASHPTFATLAGVVIVFGALYGLFNGTAPSALSEMFPTNVRYTALSVGYNAAVMVFGGFAPFICTYLVRLTGMVTAPSFYVTFCALVTLCVLLNMRRAPRPAPV
jgi:MHS family proline/betaine transporter-like MFS transporter